MQNLSVIEYEGIRVLTSKQLAEAYGTKPDVIGYNYRYNKERYKEGKHYIMLEKRALREYKRTNIEIQRSLPKISKLYLWTEKGALLHAKSLNTDKAWEVYDYLVDFYFRAKDVITKTQTESVQPSLKKPRQEELLDIPNNKEIQEKIKRIHNHCIAMQCMLELYNRYIDSESANSLRKAIDTIGAEICLDSFQIKQIKVELKQ